MTGYNYPDDFYDDALAKQTPTGAYNSASLTDAVSKPPHYDLGKYQAIDVIVEVAKTITDPVEATFASHMLKYALRWPRKGGLQDLYKERQYLDWLIAHVEQRTGGVAPIRGTCPSSAELPPNLRAAVLRESGIGDVRPVMAAEADRLSGDVL